MTSVQRSKQGDLAAIDSTLRCWAQAVGRSDVAAATALITEDGEFWSHGVAAMVGRAAVAEVFHNFFSRYALEQEFQVQEQIVSGDWAFVRGLEVNHLKPRAGGEEVLHRQRAFSVLRRDADGSWRFARGMTNGLPAA